ncbi:MAG: hypothetical protein ACRCZS_02190 [Chroococcidiopsis sp.]
MHEDLETDQTNNPFILVFADAVEFKIRYAAAHGFEESQVLAEIEPRKGVLEDNEIEVFLYPTTKTLKRAEDIFQKLTEITAILAFVRGGIDMFGWHFQVTSDEIKIGKLKGWQRGGVPQTEWKVQERRTLDGVQNRDD